MWCVHGMERNGRPTDPVTWYAASWTYIARHVPKRGVNARHSNALQALAFTQGIMWMHLCADEIVGVFQAAGRVAGVRESLLGGTLMAWGASAGDLAAGTSIPHFLLTPP